VTRFYGLHRVKPHKEDRAYIVVMHNILCASYFDMDEIYDLKGSTVGRSAEADNPTKLSTDGSAAIKPKKKPGVMHAHSLTHSLTLHSFVCVFGCGDGGDDGSVGAVTRTWTLNGACASDRRRPPH
jgi:hypothetical protein